MSRGLFDLNGGALRVEAPATASRARLEYPSCATTIIPSGDTYMKKTRRFCCCWLVGSFPGGRIAGLFAVDCFQLVQRALCRHPSGPQRRPHRIA